MPGTDATALGPGAELQHRRRIEMLDDEEQTTEEVEVDFSALGLEDSEEVTTEQPTEPAAEATEENDGEYPGTWKPILDKLPNEFHRSIADELKKWDKGVNERFQQIHQQYEPWKPFKEANVSPDSLRNAYMLAQRLEDNPPGFLEDLRATLIEQGLYKEAAEVQEAIDEEEEEVDPRDQQLQQLLTRQQAMENALITAQQQALEQQQAAQIAQEIDLEFNQIEDKVGGRLSPQLKVEIATRAVSMSERLNRQVSLDEAFNDLNRLIANSRKSSPGARAPKITPGGGGIPVTQHGDDLSTSEGRSNASLRLIKAMRGE